MPAPFFTTTWTLSGIEIGDHAQLFDLRLALVDAGAGISPGIDVGLAEARLHRAADDAVDVGDRAVGGDRADVDLVGRDGVGDHAADRIIGAAGAARADAEEPLLGQCREPAKPRAPRAGAERQRPAAADKTNHAFVLPQSWRLIRQASQACAGRRI